MSENRGLSAAQAGKTSKRTAKPRLIAPASRYVIKDGDKVIASGVTTGEVKKLCPDIKDTTLKRRLENGVRDIKDLKRPASVKPMKSKIHQQVQSHLQKSRKTAS